MRRRNAFYAAAVLTIAALAPAHADGPDLIAVRKAGQDLINGNFAYIRSVVAAKGEVKPLEVPAQAIAKWAPVFPSLFPPGTDKGETRALPAIWSDPAGFQKAADALKAAALKLADAAKAGDADAVTADTKELGDTCAACHKSFRAK